MIAQEGGPVIGGHEGGVAVRVLEDQPTRGPRSVEIAMTDEVQDVDVGIGLAQALGQGGLGRHLAG